MTGGEKLHQRYMAMLGAKEWDENVRKIQTWFYGRYVRASWCATSLCYFANQVGLKLGKHENVHNLLLSCIVAANKRYGRYFSRSEIPSELKKGDILFWLWDGKIMSLTSSKHVGIADCNCMGDKIPCLGGNQSDAIRVTWYPREKLYAVYRPY